MCCAYLRQMVTLCTCWTQMSLEKAQFENVCRSRYLISDDLRPEFGAYGQSKMVTPNVDRLAAEGTVFLHAYCQQAVCGPSRASFMTGRRPHHTQVFGNGADFREHGVDARGTPGAEWITMPEHFKRSNWTTLGGGKTFHVSPDMDVRQPWCKKSDGSNLCTFSPWLAAAYVSAKLGPTAQLESGHAILSICLLHPAKQ